MRQRRIAGGSLPLTMDVSSRSQHGFAHQIQPAAGHVRRRRRSDHPHVVLRAAATAPSLHGHMGAYVHRRHRRRSGPAATHHRVTPSNKCVIHIS